MQRHEKRHEARENKRFAELLAAARHPSPGAAAHLPTARPVKTGDIDPATGLRIIVID